MVDDVAPTANNARVLTGRVSEYRTLVAALSENPGLVVISADPWSGTSELLETALRQLPHAWLVADARACSDDLDLAMTIADAAIARWARDANAWWLSQTHPFDVTGLRISHTLSEQGIDLDALRLGSGPGAQRLSEAIELLLALTDGRGTLAIDHLGLMLAGLSSTDQRQLLADLRALGQRHRGLELVLVEHAEGTIGAALRDPNHPLFHAAQTTSIRRPSPDRFIDDLAVTSSWIDSSASLVHAAAELAAGVPALTWRIVDLAEPESDARSAWSRLRALSDPSTVRTWDTLRQIHPLAQPVVAAISNDLGPYTVVGNPKSVNDALVRLRSLGVAWRRAPRRWALSDPLLVARVRDHPPSWVARRRA